MHALIITGTDIQAVTARAQAVLTDQHIHPSEQISIESDQSIGIDAIRALIHQCSLQSSGQRGIWIKDAARLTTEAQNALLKLLEEPPARTTIMLTVSSPDGLLPTIISRCQLIRVRPTATKQDENNRTEQHDFWQQILNTDPPTRLALLPDLGKDRTAYSEFLQAHLRFLHATLYETTSQLSRVRVARALKQLLVADQRIQHNANAQLALDWCFLTL